jgi:hypothetical protein
MWRTCGAAVIAAAVSVGPSVAQVSMRPTPPPDRTANGEPWYTSREPIFVHGAYYERAGASVFFDGDTMVAVGRVGGVPVYADVTLEPYSVVFVPIGGGLVQPYEKRRAGELAGTTGSRAPSFPVSLDADASPTRESAILGMVESEQRSRDPESEQQSRDPAPAPARMVGTSAVARVASGPVWTALRPVGSRGIWIPFEGRVWTSAGWPEPLDPARFVASGTYAGFPVYRVEGRADVVFVPVVEGGLLTPYRRTEDPAK